MDDIKKLLEKYYAGKCSLDEEDMLRNLLKSMNDLPKDIKADAELFAMMEALSTESSTAEINLNVEEETKEIALTEISQHSNFSWFARIAAGFSLLVIGTFAGWILGRQDSESSDVASLRQDISEMKELVALSQLRDKSASERIMATYEFKKLDSASDEILDALINTFNNDDNPNVKNAAAEALFRFGNHDKVRKAFINGLTNQNDPVLQIKLIDMLVGLDEKRALPRLQEMMQEEAQMKVVKQKAAQGIGKLL